MQTAMMQNTPFAHLPGPNSCTPQRCCLQGPKSIPATACLGLIQATSPKGFCQTSLSDRHPLIHKMSDALHLGIEKPLLRLDTPKAQLTSPKFKLGLAAGTAIC